MNSLFSLFNTANIPCRVILISSPVMNDKIQLFNLPFVIIDENNKVYKNESNINMIINIKLDKNINHNVGELIKGYSSELNIFYNQPINTSLSLKSLLSVLKLNHLENNEIINSKLCEIRTSLYRINEIDCKIKILL